MVLRCYGNNVCKQIVVLTTITDRQLKLIFVYYLWEKKKWGAIGVGKNLLLLRRKIIFFGMD